MLIRMDHPNARYSTSKQKQQLKLLILVLQLIKSMGNVTDGQLSIFMIFLKQKFIFIPVKNIDLQWPQFYHLRSLWWTYES